MKSRTAEAGRAVRIYLDHNATTPLHPAVHEALGEASSTLYGNPSSPHAEGAAARAAVELARERVAALLGAAPDQLIFTGSATEANNSVVAALARPGSHVVTTTVEHPSIEEPLQALEAAGLAVTRVPVDGDGRLDTEAFAAAFRAETRLASVIWANNETGVIQPVVELAARARKRGVHFHLDATQALGKLPVAVAALGADSLAASAHKLNGPKGVGCLWLRGALEPLLRGGPQERRRRGGTENLLGIVGMGVAAEWAGREIAARAREHAALRDRLWDGIAAKVPGVTRNGGLEEVLPNTLNVEFAGAPGDLLLEALDLEGVACSSGAACASGSIDPSPVLLAMGRTPEQARASLRFSLGLGNGAGEIDRLLAILPDLVARVRGALAP